jgi:hypothetical protein
MKKYIHIVWSPTAGPQVAYHDPGLAHAHAMTMLGVEVSSCELRQTLPEVVRDDMQVAEFEDDDTPPASEIESEEVDVEIVDIDDANDPLKAR